MELGGIGRKMGINLYDFFYFGLYCMMYDGVINENCLVFSINSLVFIIYIILLYILLILLKINIQKNNP
jgi:hypothetical protein